MSACEDCGRPFGHGKNECRSSLGDMGMIGCLSHQLRLLRQKLAASERENKAWRGLFEYAEDRGGEFGMQKCSDGTWYADYRAEDAEGDTPQEAAVDLATKLGLLDKDGG